MNTDVPVKGRENQQLAEAILGAKLKEIAEGRHLDVKKSCKLTLLEFSKIYIQRHAVPNMDWQNEQYLINSICRSSLGPMALSEITQKHIEDFRSDHMDKWKPSTVNRNVQAIQRMFGRAVDWAYLSENPLTKIKHFPEKLFERDRILSSEEQDRLFDAIESSFYTNTRRNLADCVLIYLNTGLRKNELMGCKWNDIDFELGVIKVMNRKNCKPLFAPMNDITRRVLARRKAHKRDNQYVFQSTDRIAPYDPRLPFERACRLANIKDFSLHDLRHTFASNLAMHGVDISAIKDLLGHSDIKMTMRYIKYNPASMLSAVKKIEPLSGTNLVHTTKEARDAEFKKIIEGAV